MLRYPIGLLCLAAATSAFADAPRLLKEHGFVEASVAQARTWNMRFDHVYSVSLPDQAGCLEVDLQSEPAPSRVEHQEGALRYEGTDNGEWGGELAVIGPRGNRRVLLEDNVHSFLRTDDALYVFTGLAHLTLSRGAIYRVRSPALDPKVERVTLLPDAPRVVLRDPRRTDIFRAFIVGYSSLTVFTRLDALELIEVPLVDTPWSTLYPDSAVMLGVELILGMRGGIAVMTIPDFGTPDVTLLTHEAKPAADGAGADWPDRRTLCPNAD